MDGEIVVGLNIDNKKAQAELDKLRNKIFSLEKKQNKDSGALASLKEQSAQIAVNLDEAKAKLEQMKASDGAFSKEDIAVQAETVKAYQAEFNAVEGSIERINRRMGSNAEKLGEARDRAGELTEQLSGGRKASENLGKAVEGVNRRVKKLENRIVSLAKRVFIFSLITKALRGVREWMGNVVKTNAEASKAIANLKGAFLTLAQPLVDVVIPAFITFVNVLTSVVATVASLLSSLFGKTLDQSKQGAKSLNDEAKAISGTGKAADKASKSLASFDEINQIGNKSDSGGGGGSSASGIAPQFDFKPMEDGLSKMKMLAEGIAAALLYFALPEQFQHGLTTVIGLLLIVDGVVRSVKAGLDAWNNGVSWDNLYQMLLGLAEMVGGLYLVFGSVGAAIGLIVAGAGMLAVAFHDIHKNGVTMQNTLLGIAGILATGIGIAILTGSFIPALIAGIAALLFAITNAYGQGEKFVEGIYEILDGFKEFFVGVFTGDITMAMEGITKIFEGLQTTVDAVIDGVHEMFDQFFDWLDQKTNGQFHDTIMYWKDFFGDACDFIKGYLDEILQNVKDMLNGIVKFISGVFTGDFDLALQGIKDVAKALINLLLSWLDHSINAGIDAINTLLDGLKALTAVKLPDWMGGGGFDGITIPHIPHFPLPRLATGAVIPPNREFLAMLGDQKSGTNIEAPLETIVAAFRQAMSEYNGGNQTVIMEIDHQQFAKLTYNLANTEGRRVGVNLVEG